LKPNSAPPVFEDSVILKDRQDFQDFARRVITQPQFNFKKTTLCYRGSSNGFDAGTFHNLCNGKGPTITIIKATTGKVFGGITRLTWSSAANYKADETNQLFSMDRKEIYAHKLPLSSYPYSIYDNAGYGPTFGGGHDIHVATNGNSNTNSYTNFGHTYEVPSGADGRTHLAGAYNY
jgi:hypothetical protein